MSGRCVRLRRIFIRTLSPKFWNAVLHNRCQAWFGGMVRKSVILTYALFEVIVATAIGLFYWKYKQMGWLSLISHLSDYKIFMTVMFFRVLFGCIGVFAACRRKIRTMRCYFFTFPMAVLCAGIAAGPFINMRCYCVDYAQCEMAIAFGKDHLLNEFPDPFDHDQLHDPHWETPPKASGELSPHGGNVVEDDKAPKGSDSSSGSDGTLDGSGGNARRIAELPPRRFRRLGKRRTLLPRSPRRPRRRLPTLTMQTSETSSPRLDDSYKLERKGGMSIDELIGNRCACRASIQHHEEHHFGHQFITFDSNRKSCRYSKDRGNYITWCKVDPRSQKKCDDKRIKTERNYNTEDALNGKDFNWSEALCKKSGCKCSDLDMMPSGEIVQQRKQDAPLNKSTWNTKLGGECGLHRREDKVEWCFVGFDTKCAHRDEYILSEPDLPARVKKIEDISQFMSSIPCQHVAVATSASWCRLWRNMFCVVLAPLTLGPVPMAVIVYLFLRNRCGDLVIFRSQFAVEFSSSSSDDDFDIVDESPRRSVKLKGKQGRKPGRSKSRSSVESAEVEFQGGEDRFGNPLSDVDNKTSKSRKQKKQSFSWNNNLDPDDEDSDEDASSATKKKSRKKRAVASEEAPSTIEMADVQGKKVQFLQG